MTSYMVERGVCPIQEYFRLKKVTLPDQKQIKNTVDKVKNTGGFRGHYGGIRVRVGETIKNVITA